MKKFNAIDLFCGAGGLSLGFQQAGFNIIVGVDNEQAALDTFEFNHKGAIGLNADLSKRETFDLILKTAGDRKIDVVIAGPPCQGFSLTGPRNFDDPRNKLYLAVIEMVKQYNPKGFIIENVPGMANMYKGQVKDEVLKRFRKMGYNIDCRILSNLIPAHLFKDGLRHIHPDPEQARTITVREAARLQTFPDDYYFNCSQTDAFKMIGNAVPPLFAKKVAYAIYHLIQEN